MNKLLKIENEIKIDGFYSIYYFEHGKNFTHSPEKHDFWELVYVDEGEIIAISEGIGRRLQQGAVIFHEPNEVHAHVSDRKVTNNMMVISFKADCPAMDFFKKKVFTLGKKEKVLISLFIEEAQKSIGNMPHIYSGENGLSDAKRIHVGSTQLLECYFIEFLISLLRQGEEKELAPNDMSRMIASNSIMGLILERIEKSVYENLKIDEICREFMIGKTKLISQFKEYMNMTPIEYHRNLKIKEAKRLLREEEYSVSEISDALGYTSIHIFSRAFKSAVGFSPKEYQRSVLKNNE